MTAKNGLSSGFGSACVSAATALLIASGAWAAPAHRLSADDLPKLVRITDPQVSRDGRSIAVVISRANLKEDRWDAELDLVDVASASMRALTYDREGVAAPRWSPSGDRIAFLAQDASKKLQVFVLRMDGGDAVQLTHAKGGVSVFTWRPDGRAVAFAAPDDEPERKDEAKFDDAFEVGNNGYQERSRNSPVHIWIQEVGPHETGAAEPTRLTSGAWSLPRSLAPNAPPSQLVWSADGKSVIFTRAETPLTGDVDTQRLFVADVASGKLRALAESKAEQTHPLASPDGTHLAFAHPRGGVRGNEQAVYVGGPTAEAAAMATGDLDHNLELVGWGPDGRSLLVEGVEGTHAALWMQTLGGSAQKLDLGVLDPGAASIGANGGVAVVATRPDAPPELYYLTSPGAKPVQLTHLQIVAEGLEVGRQETVHWTSDGLDIDGVLTYPPGYRAGKKLPLVLYIHGGPVATSLETFSPSSHILAAQGWLVLEPNYRGSDNEGNAFQTAIFNHASSAPGRDIMAGVEAMKARGIVDETRIAVSGWSYGGQMTSWMIGAYPDVWRAAVAGAPVTDLVDQYSLSDNNVLRATAYGPSPFVGDNMKAYEAESPISNAWRIKAPTLIMSDVGDWRVVTTEAYKLFHALKDNHVPVRFIAFPVNGHSPSDPIRSRDVWRRWVGWLKPYLNGEGPMADATQAGN